MDAELKAELKEMRQQVNMVLTELARLTATLGERCTTRLETIRSLSDEVETHGKHIKQLQQQRAKDIGYASGASAVIAIIVTLVSKFWSNGAR